jgi:hypothetical protein
MSSANPFDGYFATAKSSTSSKSNINYEYGFLYSKSSPISISSTYKIGSKTPTGIIASLTNLDLSSKYYIAPVVKYGVKFFIGNTISFDTYNPTYQYELEFVDGVLEEFYNTIYTHTAEFTGYTNEQEDI